MHQCLHLQELHLDVKLKQVRSHRLFISISKLIDVNRMLIENSINAALRDKKWLQIFMNISDISYHIVIVLIMTEQLVHVHHEVLWLLIPCHSRAKKRSCSVTKIQISCHKLSDYLFRLSYFCTGDASVKTSNRTKWCTYHHVHHCGTSPSSIYLHTVYWDNMYIDIDLLCEIK